MSLTEKGLGNSQTLCVELSELKFEPVEETGGHATVIRFRVENEAARRGDTLLVLDGAEICFHGLIGSVEDGWGVATDRRGSTLSPNIQ